MRAVRLSFEECEPNPLAKLNARTYGLRPVLMDSFFAGFVGKKLGLVQEGFRKEMFGYLREGLVGVVRNDEKSIVRQGIMDDKSLRTLSIDIDKSRVDFVRKLILEEQFEKAMYVACQIETEEIFKKCLLLIESMGWKTLARRIAEMALENGVANYMKVTKPGTQVVPIGVIDQMLKANAAIAEKQDLKSAISKNQLDRPDPSKMNLNNNFMGSSQPQNNQRSFMSSDLFDGFSVTDQM
jgi:hypothetical protein